MGRRICPAASISAAVSCMRAAARCRVPSARWHSSATRPRVDRACSATKGESRGGGPGAAPPSRGPTSAGGFACGPGRTESGSGAARMRIHLPESCRDPQRWLESPRTSAHEPQQAQQPSTELCSTRLPAVHSGRARQPVTFGGARKLSLTRWNVCRHRSSIASRLSSQPARSPGRLPHPAAHPAQTRLVSGQGLCPARE
jgi:hypothetical protein